MAELNILSTKYLDLNIIAEKKKEARLMCIATGYGCVPVKKQK